MKDQNEINRVLELLEECYQDLSREKRDSDQELEELQIEMEVLLGVTHSTNPKLKDYERKAVILAERWLISNKDESILFK